MRLSGTELVAARTPSDYPMTDIVWELGRVHDRSLRMKVRYDRFRDATGQDVTQERTVKYETLTDLTRRVSTFISDDMHRIRPVWLYWDTAVIVIRDVAFDIPAGVELPYQEILWKNPRRNDYEPVTRPGRVARLETADLNKLELDRTGFPKRDDTTLDFDPMSRQAFRVLLLRPDRERPLFRALTVAFVALFALAAIGFVWDARKDWGRSSAAAGPERKGLVPDSRTPAFTGRA